MNLERTQQAYERIRAWLTRPGATRATGDGGNCVYYDRDTGNRCAVGCLLSDDVAHNVADTEFSVRGLIEKDAGARKDLEGIDVEFLSVAQSYHDQRDNWSDGGFKVELLDRLASNFKLKVVQS
jgi:hypothetical protein